MKTVSIVQEKRNEILTFDENLFLNSIVRLTYFEDSIKNFLRLLIYYNKD